MGASISVTPDACDPKSVARLNTLVRLASQSADWTERDARYLLNKIDQILRDNAWPDILEGEPKTWERFCRECLKYEASYFDKIREGVGILEAQGISGATVEQALRVAQQAATVSPLISFEERATKGGLGNVSKGRAASLYYNEAVMPQLDYDNGTRADYLTARIARDRPDILERMKAGEYRSVRQAALEAGIVKPYLQIPYDPERAARAIRRHFTPDQIAALVDLLTEETP